MNVSEIASVVEKVAPLLASGLTGGASGVVISLIESCLGVKVSDVPNTIASDPDSILKLKALEEQHKEFLLNNQASEATSDDADRIDARKEAIAGNYEWFVHFLALVITLAFFFLVIMTIVRPPDQTDHDIFNMMLGTFAATWCSVISFYFGTVKK